MKQRLILKTLHGSHLYGLDTPNSDKDYKGIFLPADMKELMLGYTPKHIKGSTGDDKSKNGEGDVDTEYLSLHYFFELCQKGEMIAIDMLHTPKEFTVYESTSIWSKIRNMRDMFYCSDMSAYLGYIRKQTSKYGLKGTRMGALEEVLDFLSPYFTDVNNINHQRVRELQGALPINDYCYWVNTMTPNGPQTFYEVLGKKFQDSSKTYELFISLQKVYDNYGERAKLAKNNEGIDWKAVSHAVRAAFQLKMIYEEGDIIFPLQDDVRALLLEIKLGNLDFESEASPILTDLTDQVMELSRKSNLPEKPDRRIWENFLYEAYLDHLVYL